MLKGERNLNWPKFLSQVVQNYNNTPNKKLGFLKPNSIESPYDSLLVAERKREFNLKTYEEPDYKVQENLQKSYEKNKKNLQVGDYVYADFKDEPFIKSFHTQIRKICFITTYE